MMGYLGAILGDIACGMLSQRLQSRKKAILIFLIFGASFALFHPMFSEGTSSSRFYLIRLLIGFGNGYSALLVAWVAVVFVSLLVHELGHALTYRWFGQSAHVVLYHFGGLAIPDAWGRRGARRPLERLLVSAAGPLAQLLFAAAVVAGLKAAGFRVPLPLPGLGDALGLSEGRPLPSTLAFAIVWFLLQVNIFWPLINLLPVPPLDGGQIAREALLAVGIDDAPRIAGLLGTVTGGLVAFWAYSRGEPYLGIMFAMLAVSCWQNLPGNTPWRRWN
jgi:Zn-dependent protease